VVSQRVLSGMVMMYHAQEKTINMPAPRSPHAWRHPQLDDAHRAQTHPHDRRLRAAELRFNYYGTIGTNRDEIVVVRKMNKVDWLDTPATIEPALAAQQA